MSACICMHAYKIVRVYLHMNVCVCNDSTRLVYRCVCVCVSLCICVCVLSARLEKTAGSGVDMNGYAVLFQKACVHLCNTIRIHNALHYCRLLEHNVFGIGKGGVRSKVTPFPLLLPSGLLVARVQYV
jgi:hypothetical protein